MARLEMIFEAFREERIEHRRRRRQLRTRFLENFISDPEFVSKYRLSRELFEELCQDIVPLLPLPKNSRAIDRVTKILTALTFYASGSYQGAVAQNLDAPMRQQTVSKCIQEVTTALNESRILRKYIRFPQTRESRSTLKRNFSAKYRIPDIIGCIGCTHVAIIKPVDNKERYFNRKNYHSLNVQFIADNNLKILNIDASYGGATHDAFIWQHREIKEHLESLQGETAILLGDSGYPLSEYLMTPVENPVENSPESRYNRDHMQAYNLMEHMFVALKSRWRCLLAARELHYIPRVAGRITIACAVLHNMCIDRGEDIPNLSKEDIENETNRQPLSLTATTDESPTAALDQGHRARNALIQLLELNRPRSMR